MPLITYHQIQSAPIHVWALSNQLRPYPRFEIEQNGSRYITRIVTLTILSQLHERLQYFDIGSCLVEEHIFPVPAFCREVF